VFKKIISFVLLASLMTVQASASTEGLKAAFDEMNYAVTVEWDQQDKAFYEKQVQDFSAKVRELQANGLSNEELISFVKSEIKDEKLAKDVQTAFSLIAINKMSAEDTVKLMTDTLKKNSKGGASWNGVGGAFLGLGVLFIAIGVSVGGYYGGWYSGGYSGGYYCNNYCSYDYYGNYYCSCY